LAGNPAVPRIRAVKRQIHPMNLPLTGISSMATRQVLAELAQAHGRAIQREVWIESVGGVEAARRVQEGGDFDVVVLAEDAIRQLAAGGHVHPASIRPVVRSAVAVAVRAGAGRPDVTSEAALRAAVQAAGRIGYSTGPSGTALLTLIQHWGLADVLRERLVQAKPGVPVARLLAGGEVDLGFQQLSELLHQDSVDVLGPMPPGVEIVTTFVGAVCTRSVQPDDAQALLACFCAPDAAEVKQRHGLQQP
jgi:molybdate transport system substrate-binding protein